MTQQLSVVETRSIELYDWDLAELWSVKAQDPNQGKQLPDNSSTQKYESLKSPIPVRDIAQKTNPNFQLLDIDNEIQIKYHNEPLPEAGNVPRIDKIHAVKPAAQYTLTTGYTENLKVEIGVTVKKLIAVARDVMVRLWRLHQLSKDFSDGVAFYVYVKPVVHKSSVLYDGRKDWWGP